MQKRELLFGDSRIFVIRESGGGELLFSCFGVREKGKASISFFPLSRTNYQLWRVAEGTRLECNLNVAL